MIAKGFPHRSDVDFLEIFAPFARLSYLSNSIALSAEINMEILQPYTTTSYFNNEVVVKIYIEVPELMEEMLQGI